MPQNVDYSEFIKINQSETQLSLGSLPISRKITFIFVIVTGFTTYPLCHLVCSCFMATFVHTVG